MTNEELAHIIAKKHYRSARQITDSQKECYDSALEMAQWKDEQHAKVLAKLIVELDELKQQVKSLLP